MNANMRKMIYVGLASVNAVLLVLQQQSVLPETYGHYVALASFLVAAGLKEFQAQDPMPPAAP